MTSHTEDISRFNPDELAVVAFTLTPENGYLLLEGDDAVMNRGGDGLRPSDHIQL